jgi:hypothetical protein
MLKTFQSVEVSSWDAIMDWYNEHILTGQQWIFRGQKRNDWGLVTSLERAIKDFDIRNEEVSELEFGLLRRFRRQCHHYITNLPEEHDTMEWLALMQHYGAPTRLLDWTLSLFVALYFAVEPAEEECAIWALQHEWVVEIVHNILPKEASEALEEDRNARKDRTFEMVFGSVTRFSRSNNTRNRQRRSAASECSNQMDRFRTPVRTRKLDDTTWFLDELLLCRWSVL